MFKFGGDSLIKSNVVSAYYSIFPKLTKLWVEVSDLCNSKCGTCSAWKRSKSENIIDYERLFSNSFFKDIVYILNSGSGEPSLADLKRILLIEHELLPKATLQVSTNGLLPDKVLNAVESALAVGASIDVGVSLDGIGDKHDIWRGVPGNFEKVQYLLFGLSKLQKKFCNLNFAVGSTLMDYTYLSSKQMKDFAKEFNAGFMWNWYNPAEEFYGTTNFTANNDRIRNEVKILPKSPYNNRWLTSLDTGIIPKFKCYALRSFCVVRCNGEVAPCLSKYDLSIGNIMQDDIEKIWFSQRAKQVRLVVKNCEGCLNSWGCNWSLSSEYFECLRFRLKNKLLRNIK